ncbi:MAG: diacylglycerol kinase family lipid kinase [Verrucomicrobia bacterium]|nr:MAG: diacylglycerol kinase family lipid kinase [Verrucomicrobiota bacterium]
MQCPHRYPLIFNPKARSQKSGRVLRFLMEHANRFAIYATNHAGEAHDLAARFAARGEPVVIAAGGDGTLNEVVRGLAGSETVLGILPAGTMNVFAREMSIPFDSLESAFDVIEKRHIKEIDLFEANGTPFVQMAGIGFDAHVIEETTWESKKMLGPMAYLLAGIRLLGNVPPVLEIECANGHREQGVAVLAGNGSLYGGPFRFFRNASNSDRMLDVLIYQESGYRLVMDSLKGLATGGIEMMDSTRCFQTESFTVRSSEQVPLQVDGELIGRSLDVQFRLSEHRLRVIAPASSTSERT